MKKNNIIVMLLFGLSTMMASCNKQDIYESKLNGTWECHSIYALFNGEIVEELPLNEVNFFWNSHSGRNPYPNYYTISFFENGIIQYCWENELSCTSSYVISNGMLFFLGYEWEIIKLTNKELVLCDEKLDYYYEYYSEGYDCKAIDEYKGIKIYGVFDRFDSDPQGYFYYNEQKDRVKVRKQDSIYLDLVYMIYKKK